MGEILVKNWIYKEHNTELIDEISKEFNISTLLATVINNRGLNSFSEIQAFLNKDLGCIHDPFLLRDADKAVERIQRAIENNETITIYGDYDVDGVTSIAIIAKYLSSLGAKLKCYIPDRMKEGYGLNIEAVDSIAEGGTSLVITVDCGITAVDEVKHATNLGMDIIITDHHECKQSIPEAYAVINPKRPDCDYPFKELAGVGVVFKLIQALAGREKLPELIKEYSSIVCLGTIADVVPLLGENRIVVSYGLSAINTSNNIGIQSLLKVAGLNGKKITSGNVGFTIAPRINAAGRIGSAVRAVRLFLTKKEDIADAIAKELNEENINRQNEEAGIFEDVLRKIENEVDISRQKILIVCGENWHHGVIGIVASRIIDRFHRPCILISLEGENGKGSGRSISGFNLFNALTECGELLKKFGGHELAAGLTVERSNIDSLKEVLENYADSQLCEEDLIPRIRIDSEIKKEDLTLSTAKQLQTLEPFGMGNSNPIFSMCKAVITSIRTVGEGGKHLKASLKKDGVLLEAIGFGMGQKVEEYAVNDIIDVAFSLDINTYNGLERLQLILKDMK